MGGPGLFRRRAVEQRAVVPEAEGDRRKPHQRAVSRGPRVGRTGHGIACPHIPAERRARRNPDVEATPRTGVFAFLPPADEPVNQVPAVQCPAFGETLGEGQRHRGVVGPFARSQTEGAAADHVFHPLLPVTGFELEGRADRVPHRETQEGAHGAVPGAFGGRGGQRFRGDRASCDVSLLVARFEGMLGTGRPNPPNRFVRSFAELHEETCSDGARAAQTALAVHEHVESKPQAVPDGRPRDAPRRLESRIGRLPVRDRQVPPLHVPVRDRPGEALNPQVPHFLLGDQAHDRRRAPPPDPFEVQVQVAVPVPRDPVRVILAGAQGDADAAETVLRAYRVDADRMRLAGFYFGHEPLSFR